MRGYPELPVRRRPRRSRPGSISRRMPTALVDFAHHGWYPGAEILPQECARNASMNERTITRPNRRTAGKP
jgi:hypothetical protein